MSELAFVQLKIVSMIEGWILMLVLPCFPPGVKLVWFFYASYHFEDVTFNLPYVRIPFVLLLNYWIEVFVIQGSREMVEVE